MKDFKDLLVKRLSNCKEMSTREIAEFFEESGFSIKKSTLNWRLYELVNQGIISRVGRGQYILGQKKGFNPILSDNNIRLSTIIKDNFPLLSYCLWDTNLIKPFTQDIPSIFFTIIEVEKEGKEAVYHKLREDSANVFLDDNKKYIRDILNNLSDLIVIKTLISEAPLKLVNNLPIPLPEKILVDLYCDTLLFDYLQGNELQYIFQNMLSQFSFNKNKMLRYAARRGKKREIEAYIKQIIGKKN